MLHSKYDKDRQATMIQFRVGIEETSIVHGHLSLPADVKIDVFSDVAVMAVDATVGGGLLDSVVGGAQAFLAWVWGTG